jgi:hypothetical protein
MKVDCASRIYEFLVISPKIKMMKKGFSFSQCNFLLISDLQRAAGAGIIVAWCREVLILCERM